MSVCNVKVAHIRPQYKNLKDWMADDNNVYIGRGRIVFIDGARYPKKHSMWANPYIIGVHGTRDEVLQKYESYIRNEIVQRGPLILHFLLKIKGKNLGCWCHPDKCHGDILLKIIEEHCN